MLGLSHFNKYFPIPTTEASLKKLKVFWMDMIDTLEYTGKLKWEELPLAEQNDLRTYRESKSTKMTQPTLEQFIQAQASTNLGATSTLSMA